MSAMAIEHGRILIVGANAIGLQVAEQLKLRGEKVLVVDSDAESVDRTRSLGFVSVRADYTEDDELRRIGVGSTARVLFTLLLEDANNVFLVISARALDPELHIVAVTESPDSAQRLLSAGATKVIDPYEITGRKIYQLIRRPFVSEALEATVFGQENLNVAEVEIPAGSFLDGLLLEQLELQRDYNLILLGVVDREVSNELIFATTSGRHKLDEGDLLVVIGPQEELRRFQEDLRRQEV